LSANQSETLVNITRGVSRGFDASLFMTQRIARWGPSSIAMSAMGHERTSHVQSGTSAFGLEPDLER
jgi:hypothetical protein